VLPSSWVENVGARGREVKRRGVIAAYQSRFSSSLLVSTASSSTSAREETRHFVNSAEFPVINLFFYRIFHDTAESAMSGRHGMPILSFAKGKDR
jgi:hypothetical protein